MIIIRSIQINEEIVYYITDDKYFNIPDREIAKMLNIDYELYIEILKKYGATQHTRYYYYYYYFYYFYCFNNLQDAVDCLNDEELQLYIIMEELSK